MPFLTTRTYMHYDARPNDFWTHNLEWEMDTLDVTTGTWDDLLQALEDALAALLLDNVFIDRTVISTWIPDSDPYDPEALRVYSHGVFGTNVFVGTDPVDDDLVVFIRKNVASGRTGKIQLRGAMVVTNLSTEAGSWVFTSASRTQIQGDLDVYSGLVLSYPMRIVGVSLLDTIYHAAAEGVPQVVEKVYSETPIGRTVQGFTLIGPTERQDTQ